MSILSFLGIKTVKQSNDAAFAAQQKAIVDKIAALNSQATNAAANSAVPGYVATPSTDYKNLTNITTTMGTTISNIWTWIKSNMLLSAGIALVVVMLFFPKVLRGMFGRSTHRVRHRRPKTIASVMHRRRVHRAIIGSSTRRRTTHRRSKGAKKPWQVKGSLAARRHMAQIRARR